MQIRGQMRLMTHITQVQVIPVDGNQEQKIRNQQGWAQMYDQVIPRMRYQNLFLHLIVREYNDVKDQTNYGKR